MIKPIRQHATERLAQDESARIDFIERIAWEQFHKADDEGDETKTVKDILTKEVVDGQSIG